MKTNLIIACDIDGGIAKNGEIPWHIPEDLQFFRKQTLGNVVIMGRKTYHSLPPKYRPLPNRINIVLTRSGLESHGNVFYMPSLTTAINGAKNLYFDRDIYIIGGAEVYKHALELGCAEYLYITYVQTLYDCDTFIPLPDDRWALKEVIKEGKGFVIKKYKGSY
jgi:dihydrofolate reductase